MNNPALLDVPVTGRTVRRALVLTVAAAAAALMAVGGHIAAPHLLADNGVISANAIQPGDGGVISGNTIQPADGGVISTGAVGPADNGVISTD